MKQKIKIAGAGLSGLCAAINLAKAGYEVEVFEGQKSVGAAKNGDWQGLENWTEAEDVLTRIQSCGLGLDFPFHPFYEMKFYTADLTLFSFKNKKPIFYLVKRGRDEGCLDYALKNQAERSGVKINYNQPLTEKQASIIATSGRKPFALGVGLNFTTDLDDQIVAILSDDLAPKGYAYLIVIGGQATIVSALTVPYAGQASRYFKNTFQTFQSLKSFSVKNEKKFAGVIYTGLKPTKDKIYTGEAGGFQDYFLGFGMYHAIRSGYLVSQAIRENISFNNLAKKELRPLVKASLINRFIFERLGNKGYQIFLRQLHKKPDFTLSLNKLYTHTFSKIALLKKLTLYVQNKN